MSTLTALLTELALTVNAKTHAQVYAVWTRIVVFATIFPSACAIRATREIHFRNAKESRVSFPPIYEFSYKTIKIIAPRPAPEIIDPCNPSPCGINAECRERNNAAACVCLPGLQGDPYTECKPECTINQECASNLACIANKCKDPCPGVCGTHAMCSVRNHNPSCTCDPGYFGDPFRICTFRTTRKQLSHLWGSLY